jgi:hypothetical protein
MAETVERSPICGRFRRRKHMQQWRRGLHPRLGLLASIVLVVGACGNAA